MDIYWRGKSVIDYVLGDKEGKKNVEKLMVGDNVESDHHPLIVWIKTEKNKEGKKEKEEKEK